MVSLWFISLLFQSSFLILNSPVILLSISCANSYWHSARQLVATCFYLLVETSLGYIFIGVFFMSGPHERYYLWPCSSSSLMLLPIVLFLSHAIFLFSLPLTTVWSLTLPRAKALTCCSFTQVNVFPNACGLSYLSPCKCSYKISFLSSNTDFYQSGLVHWCSMPIAYGTQNFFGQSFDAY